MILMPLGGFSVINIGGRGVQPSWTLGFFIAVLYFLNLISGKKRIYKDNIIIFLLILCFSVFLSIKSPLLSGDKSRVIDYLSTFLQFLLAISIFFTFTSYKLPLQKIEKIVRWYLIIGALMAIIGILQTASSYFGHPWEVTFTNESWIQGGGQKFGHETILGNFKRAAGLLREPRQLGAYLFGALSICLYLILRSSKIFKPSQQIFIFIVITIGLFCTFSISAYLVGTFCLLIVVALKLKLFSNYKSTVHIALTLLSAFAIFYLMWLFTDLKNLPYWNRFKLPTPGYLWYIFVELVDRKIAAGPYARYVGNISFALHICMDHPFFGVGINNLEYFEMKGYHGAHQPWALFGECGLIGVISFMAFIIVFLAYIRRLRNRCIKLKLGNTSYSLLLDIAFIIVLLAPIKGMASLFVYYGSFFWFDMTLAGIIYFNLKKDIYKKIAILNDT
jgi:hypothetical protein